VADLLYSAGDARKAIPAIAFTLPNDEEVIREKGTKEVILRNLLNEKFRNVVVPIGEFLSGSLRFTLDADSEIEGFVTHTILHEISHSLGLHQIIVAAERTTVNKALRERHATFEEAKADVLAACWFLWSGGSDGGSINAGSAAYYLPGVVRSLRFGITVAHGLANLLQFNYSSRQGAIRVSSDGLPRIDRHHLQSGLLALAKDILEIQQAGDYLAAKAFAKTYCKHTPVTRTLLGKLEHIPIDILPSFFNKNCRRAG
jgi:hypothetical protein